MNTPLPPHRLVERLAWPTEPVDMVLDTDTYNEIDDQFALVYALFSEPRLNLQAVYAAPFHNKRSSGPGDGMVRSYEEIERVLDRMGRSIDRFAFKGADRWLGDPAQPVRCDAVDHLIDLARSRPAGSPLYVCAIGAITNVASALLAAPDIAERVVVVWLAGHPLNWPRTDEFNMRGDADASRHVLDCGVPLVLVPCAQVAEKLLVTVPEIKAYVEGRGPIGDYLARIFGEYNPNLHNPGVSKVIWDIAPVAWLINGDWCTTRLVPSPILTADLTWSIDPRRHFIQMVTDVQRDEIFGDLFGKIARHAASGG